MRAQIVMATHNPRPDLLSRQLTSLQEQSVDDWRCLIFDDSSADRTTVADLVAGDPRFTLLPPTSHLGAYLAFQHLLERTGAEPVFLCDQDDRWHPDKMLRMLSDPAAAVFSAMRVVDDTGNLVRERYLPRPPGPHALTPAAILLMNSVSGASLMVRPEVIRAALPFPAPTLRGWHDQWLAAVAARIADIHHIDEPLTDYTQHSGQVIGDGLRVLDRDRIRGYTRRVRMMGLRDDLVARAGWVRAAAARLLELPGPDDPDLQALAAGSYTRQLTRGVRAGEIPLARAMLLATGSLVDRSR